MKLLFVIDMQNDFLTGKLPIPNEAFPNLISNVQRKIQFYRDINSCEKSTHIIYTQDTHYKDYLETEEGKKLPIPHCIKNTAGWCIDERVFPQKEDTVIQKNSFGRDWGKDFMFAPLISDEPFFLSYYNEIKYSDVTDIEIIGVCTDFCVLANAMTLKAAFPNVPITIDAACCAGSTPEWHEKALDMLEHCHFNVINRKKE